MHEYFACMCMCSHWEYHRGQKRVTSPGRGVTDGCGPSCGCWEPVLYRTAIALYSWATSPAPIFILLNAFQIKTIFIVGENYKKPKSECANHLLRTLPLLHHSGKVGSCGVLSSLERQKFLLSGPCRESATCLSRGPQTGGKTAWQFPRWLHNTITCWDPQTNQCQVSTLNSSGMNWFGVEALLKLPGNWVIPARARAESHWISEWLKEGLSFPSDF